MIEFLSLGKNVIYILFLCIMKVCLINYLFIYVFIYFRLCDHRSQIVDLLRDFWLILKFFKSIIAVYIKRDNVQQRKVPQKNVIRESC